MKKVEKVSIGNYAFTIEEDAYKFINDYLSDLQTLHPKEVMEGIEERMAELFIERCPDNAIVTYQVAVEVIGILGKPEVFDEEGVREPEVPKKKLYRDIRNKVLGGVCSGMAAYCNMDITLMRIIWVLVFFILCVSTHAVSGFLVLAYIILWICMPKADTVQKRYEMRGEKISVENIAEKFGEGVTNMAEEVKDNNVMKIIGRVCTVIIGLILLIAGISGIVVGSCYLIGFELFKGFIGSFEWFSAYFGTVPSSLILVFANLVYFIPMLGMLYGGVMLIFNLKTPRWKPGLILFILWLVAIIAFAVTVICGFFMV